MFKNNRPLFVVALIAIVNALGYGIIIPVLYSYSIRFGLNAFENGLLFATFSIAQFLSTPIIGRMSDKFGRKPMLVVSITGTAISFLMMAFAPTAWFLFLARILDGITAGNIPVASAVISDTTEPKDRAKGFGIIGASFGFGFIFGPAISALTVTYNPMYPFIIAAIISLIAVILTVLLLPETNKHRREVKFSKLFDFGKLYEALFYPNVGVTLIITLLYSFAFSLFIFAFQPFSVDFLKLKETDISLIYTLFGILGLLGQVVLVQRITKKFGLKKTFSGAMLVVAFSFIGMFLSTSLVPFIAASVVLALSNAIAQPLTQTILSRETDEKSQGSILGLNASYMSIGQILGPLAGGALAIISVSVPFLAGALFVCICVYLSTKVMKPGVRAESAF